MNLLAILTLLAIFGLAGYMIFDAVKESLRRRTGVGAAPRIYCDRFRRISHSKRMRRACPMGAIVACALGLVAVCAIAKGHWHTGMALGVMAAPPAILSQGQIEEFKEVVEGLKVYGDMWPKIKTLFPEIEKLPDIRKSLAQLHEKMKKTALTATFGGTPNYGPGKFVSDDCADYLGAFVVMEAEKVGKLNKNSGANNDALIQRACGILGMQQRTALTTSDIPVPTLYGQQVSELVWRYGQARAYGTMFPMGAGTVNWPRLKTDPIFSYIAASGPVTEKAPQIEYVEFAAKKFGGIIRVPTEIDEDSLGAFGQFIARYCARQFAKIEDLTFFGGDGTATYGGISGMGPLCVTNNKLVTLGAGKTKPSDMSLTDWRNVRAQVASAALATGAYYCNRTFDSQLVTFNTIGQPLIYRPEQGPGQPATLDGYPIHWVDVIAPYSTVPNAGAVPVLFGDMSYGYLGMRRDSEIMASRDVYFATDEIGIRALERFDVDLMATDALAAIRLAVA